MDLKLADLAKRDGQTDGQTDRQMDGRMDRRRDKPADRDAWTHLKNKEKMAQLR